MQHLAAAGLWAAALLIAPQAAAAKNHDRRDAILDTQGPPGLPGLSHRGLSLNFEYMVASIEPLDTVTAEPIADERAFAYAARWLLEWPIVERHWYLGGILAIAAASVPSSAAPQTGGSAMSFANPEVWVRGMWASKSGLGAGGGLGLVVPVPRAFSPREAEVVRAVRVVRPWDYPHFQDLSLTARPFFDIRHLTGPVTLQMRQGLDVSILTRRPHEDEHRYDISALAKLYLGVAVIDELTLGLELTEVYQLTAEVSSPSCPSPCDQQRVTVAMSPLVQMRFRGIAPSLSALFPLSTPLRAEVESYYGALLHLALDL